jgi:hypothetical protein
MYIYFLGVGRAKVERRDSEKGETCNRAATDCNRAATELTHRHPQKWREGVCRHTERRERREQTFSSLL